MLGIFHGVVSKAVKMCSARTQYKECIIDVLYIQDQKKKNDKTLIIKMMLVWEDD